MQPIDTFASAGFDRVWIALHGPGGEDGALQGLLQWLEIPYTGSGVMASAIAMDKVRSKHLFQAAKIPTPDYAVMTSREEARHAAEKLGFPLIIKPSGQGSSVGMSKITERAELDAILGHAARLKEAWRAGERSGPLPGTVLGLVFHKPSLRTRVSFELAEKRLSADSVNFSASSSTKSGLFS